MKLGLLTRNPNSWCSAKIREAMVKQDVEPFCFSFLDITARAGFEPEVSIGSIYNACMELKGVIVRPIGRGSLDEIIFRLDVLHKLERSGVLIVNPPLAIERAVNKYHALTLLEEHGIPVPETVVTEDPDKALEAFKEVGGDVVLKPLFGSRGMGVCRVSEVEVARRVFNALSYNHNVLYVQKFFPHGRSDIRAFVVGGRVVAAMLRRGRGWKTNIAMGATALPFKPSLDVEELAVKSTEALGCLVAGVDIMKGRDGYIVNEINSQPGFKAIQTATGIDVAGEIVRYVVGRLRK